MASQRPSLETYHIEDETMDLSCIISSQDRPTWSIMITFDPNANRNNRPYQILHPDHYTRYLGLPIGCVNDPTRQLDNICTKFIQTMNKWRRRGRTVEGRVTMAKALLHSLLWYGMGPLKVPTTMCQTFDKHIRNFIHQQETHDWQITTTKKEQDLKKLKPLSPSKKQRCCRARYGLSP